MVTDKLHDEKKRLKKSTGLEWEVKEDSVFLEFYFLTASAKKLHLGAKLSVHDFTEFSLLKGISIFFRT